MSCPREVNEFVMPQLLQNRLNDLDGQLYLLSNLAADRHADLKQILQNQTLDE